MQLTYYGHSTFSVIVGGKTLLFDPFISPNPLAKDIDISSLNPDYILASHAHFDHIADAVQIAKQSGAKVISTYEVATWFGGQGIENAQPMNHGGSWNFDFGQVKCVNAVHSSAFQDGSYGGNPIGFIIQGDEKAFYYAGDTALTLDMQLIPRWAKLDLAILPIGSFFTMDYKDAIIAAEFVQCDKVLGVHYDTFDPYITINHDEVKQAFQDAGLDLSLLAIGESMEF